MRSLSLFVFALLCVAFMGAGCNVSNQQQSSIQGDEPGAQLNQQIPLDSVTVDEKPSMEAPTPSSLMDTEMPTVVIPSQTEAEGEAPSTVVKEFTLTAKQWEFVPSVIRVNKGDLVRIQVTSIDVAHGFSLPAFGINEDLEPDQTVTIEFLADKTGTHSFICSVFCGSGHSGMRGELVVE